MNSIFPPTRLLFLASLASPLAASDMGSPYAWILIFGLASIPLFVMPGLTIGSVLVASSGSWKSFRWSLPAGFAYGLLAFSLGMYAHLFRYILVINACAGLAASVYVLTNATTGKRPWLLLMTVASILVPAATAAYLAHRPGGHE